MGRFSKLEPNQPQPAPNQPQADAQSGRPRQPAAAGHEYTGPSLQTRLEPGTQGAPNPDADLNRSAAEWIDLADEAFLRGDARNALRWYSRALDKDTTLAEAWVSMVRVLLFRGELGQAETWTNRALSLFPTSGPLLAMRGVVHARRGMMRQALHATEAVQTEHADDPVTQIARGEVLLMADNKNADFCFNQALTMVPANDWKTPTLIGMIYEERRNWARAIHFFDTAAQRNDNNAVLWFRIAGCRRELGQSSQARLALEHARQLCPEGDSLIVQIDHAKTGSIFRRLLRLFWK